MEAAATAGVALALQVQLTLLCAGTANGCTVSVFQPPVLEADDAQEAVTVPCSFSTTGCQGPLRGLWFRYSARHAEAVCPDGCAGKEARFAVQEVPGLLSLTVHMPTSNDSAIYVCGVAVPGSTDPAARQTAAGTVLVVTGASDRVPWGLVIAVLALLSVYVASVLVAFAVLSMSKPKTLRNRETEDSQKKSARRIFQDIAQELYTKQYVRTGRCPEKDNADEDRGALYRYKRP